MIIGQNFQIELRDFDFWRDSAIEGRRIDAVTERIRPQFFRLLLDLIGSACVIEFCRDVLEIGLTL